MVAVASIVLSRRMTSQGSGAYEHLRWLMWGLRALESVPPCEVPNFLTRRSRQALNDIATSEGGARIREAFLRTREAKAWQAQFSVFPPADRLRLRYPRPEEDSLRQGDLIILKPPLPNQEKGVLIVKYTQSFREFMAIFDAERLAQRYRIVLEPSWWGYQDASLLLYSALGTDVVVQCPFQADFAFIASLHHKETGLVPLGIGAGDWVDHRQFSTGRSVPKSFDIVMVASWNPLKRHRLLFQALRSLGDTVKSVALIGYQSDGYTRDDVGEWAEAAGVGYKITWFENIPHAEVAEVIQRSRVSVMLSLREGANKAIYESMFSDVPFVISARNVGVNRDHVNAETGMLADDEELAEAVRRMLLLADNMHPRDWALENTGYSKATQALEDELHALALKSGEPWTEGILPKVNAPNLRYLNQEDADRAEAWYEDLEQYLRLRDGLPT